MAVEDASDRAALLADFGASVTVGASTVTGIFDKQFLEQLGIGGNEPMLMITEADADANSIAAGTALSIGGVNYTVTPGGRRDDGTGMTILMLEEV